MDCKTTYGFATDLCFEFGRDADKHFDLFSTKIFSSYQYTEREDMIPSCSSNELMQSMHEEQSKMYELNVRVFFLELVS